MAERFDLNEWARLVLQAAGFESFGDKRQAEDVRNKAEEAFNEFLGTMRRIRVSAETLVDEGMAKEREMAGCIYTAEKKYFRLLADGYLEAALNV